MATKRKRNGPVDRWAAFDSVLKGELPHLHAWYTEEEEFSELRIKARPDGTCLAIAKGYGSDGGPVVCFGVGYGVVAALMAIDATIHGGNWKFDKPWSPNGKQG